MSFTGSVASRLPYELTQSISSFAEIGGDKDYALFPDKPVDMPATSLNAYSEERLAERARIAQELHDTLLQGFIAVSMHLHTFVDQLPADCATAKPRLSNVIRMLDRVLEQGRRVLQGLHSSKESLTPLGEAFANVPNELGLSSEIDFRVIVHGRERELTAELHNEVYLIGREAIVNAYRHSQARAIEVEVEYRPAELRVAVRDNGCGIKPQLLQWGRKGHWGLQGMRDRAERIGARLRLWSRVALGTEIELRVPGRF